MSRKEWLRSAAVVGVTVAILAVLLSLVDIGNVARTLARAKPVYLGLALAVIPVMLGLKAYLWRVTLRMFGHPVSLWRCFTAEMATKPLVGITPSRAGEAAKVYYFRESIPPSTVLASVAYERFLDAAVLGVFGAIGLVAFVRGLRIEVDVGIELLILGGLLVVIATAVAVAARQQVTERLWSVRRIVARHVDGVRSHPRLVAVTVGVSLLRFGLSILQTLLLFFALDIEPSLLFAVTRIPVVIFVGLLPVTVAGMGTRDAAFIALFSDVASTGSLLAMGILFTTVRYWLLVLAGVPFLYYEGRPRASQRDVQ